MELSKRLQAVIRLLTEKEEMEKLRVADVGTDHGYLPIALVQDYKCKKVFAMDVNKGPLERANRHIKAYDLSGYIEMRLSDGLKALKPGEADCMAAAGMGGALMIKIMSEGKDVLEHMKYWVLQPQSEIAKVRAYLQKSGYHITAEDIVYEDGKYYPLMRVEKGEAAPYSGIELKYGPCLLHKKHPVLLEYLKQELKEKEIILERLNSTENPRTRMRREEVFNEIAETKEGILCFAKIL